MAQSIISQQLLETRKSILLHVQEALDGLSDDDSLAVLTFWSSRGGGQTTLLKLVQKFLSANRDVSILGPWDFRQQARGELSLEVLNQVAQVATGKRVVLLDNVDTLLTPDDDSTFFDFERQVLHPLLERRDTLIIATSQIALGMWHEYDVRLRHKSYYVPALTSAEVALVCEPWKVDARQAYSLTFGHPQTLDWLRVEPQLTEQEIAGRADAYFLHNLSPEAADFARAVCPLLVFNVALVRLVLAADTSAETSLQDGLFGEYIDRIRELISVGLLQWEISVGAYRFADSSVRRLLARHSRVQHPAEYERTHRIAAEYFQGEARYTSYLQSSFVSAVYHLACVFSSDQHESAGERCRKWVQDNIDYWQGADWEAVIRAWQTGTDDEGVREELQSIIGRTFFDQITQLLQTAKSSVEMML